MMAPASVPIPRKGCRTYDPGSICADGFAPRPLPSFPRSLLQGLMFFFIVLMVLEAIPDIAALWTRLCGRAVRNHDHAKLWGGLVSWWDRVATAKGDIAMLVLNAGTVCG